MRPDAAVSAPPGGWIGRAGRSAAACPVHRSLPRPSFLTRFLASRAPQKPKRSAIATKFGTSKAAALLASFNAAPIGAGSAAVDAFARNVIARAGADAPEHFYVFDLGAVMERLNVWTTSLPRVTPYYAGAFQPWACVAWLAASLTPLPDRSQVQPGPRHAGAAGCHGHRLRLRVARRD